MNYLGKDYFVDELTGDAMNDAVFERTAMTDWQLTGYLYAGGMTVCTHDGDNLVIALNNEKTINCCQKVYDFLHAPSTFGFAMRGNVYADDGQGARDGGAGGGNAVVLQYGNDRSGILYGAVR